MARGAPKKLVDVGNSKAEVTNISTILNAAAFGFGFRDKREEKPPRKEYETFQPRDQWLYEYGRLFAIVWPYPIKKGRAVDPVACLAFAACLKKRFIT